MGNRAFRMESSGVEPKSENSNGNGNSSARRFGVFEVDLRSGELRRNGIRVKLQEQPLQVLAELLDRPGEVVTREDLRSRLWPADTFVDFDHSLNTAIRRLRDALGDSAENPAFVETIARRGYRFLAPVTVVPPNGVAKLPAPEAQPVRAAGRRRRVWWIAAAVTILALVYVVLHVGFFLGQRSVTQYRVTRLTENPVDDPVRAASISRDGRLLAFSDDNGFYLRQLDTAETHSITLPAGMLATSISWFPDNTHLIVALSDVNRRSSLWEFSAFGGSPRKLLDEGSQPAVSPDGKSLAYFAGPMLHERLYVAGISVEQPRAVAGSDGDLFGRIAWSTDSRKIAFTTAKFTYGYGAKATIAIVSLSDGVRASPSTAVSLAGLEAPLAWASDGRLLYTVQESRPRQADSNLWSVRLDKEGRPTGDPIRVTEDQGVLLSVGISGGSKRIVYVKGEPQSDVYVADLQSSGAINEPQRLTLDDRQDMPYEWTTDNKQVIFISDRTGSFQIYKQAIDQTMPDLLVGGAQPASLPRLSPDGTQILFVNYSSGNDPNYEVPLLSVPLSGGAPHQIARAKWISNHQCARAPATLCIYSVMSDNNLKFFTFDPLRGPGKKVYEIKDEIPQMYNWSLSPDGNALAIAKGKWGEGDPRIHVISLRGAPERWLTVRVGAGIASIDWTADSRGIWATTSADKENTLLRVDLQGDVRVVWRPRNQIVRWAIPSRDGKRLALHVDSVTANVWMLEPK